MFTRASKLNNYVCKNSVPIISSIHLRRSWGTSSICHQQPAHTSVITPLPAGWTQWMSQEKVFPGCHGSRELARGHIICAGQLAPGSPLALQGLAKHTVPTPWVLVAREPAFGKALYRKSKHILPSWITGPLTSARMSVNTERGKTGTVPDIDVFIALTYSSMCRLACNEWLKGYSMEILARSKLYLSVCPVSILALT